MDTDQVGFSVFTTDLPTPTTITADLVAVGAAGADQAADHRRDRRAHPAERHPAVRGDPAGGRADERQPSTPASINAVVVLTDGRNEYTDNDLDGLLRDLEASAQENGVRVFTIAYGPDADLETLQADLRGVRAAAYDARNPATIDKVFADVLSNF